MFFSFLLPVPNFSCNSFCRPRVINSGIQSCRSYIEHVLDSWDLAFTLVLMLPVSRRSMILQNHLELFLQSLETGFLKLSGENIFFCPRKCLEDYFSLPCNTYFISAAVRHECLDFLGKQFLKKPLFRHLETKGNLPSLCRGLAFSCLLVEQIARKKKKMME